MKFKFKLNELASSRRKAVGLLYDKNYAWIEHLNKIVQSKTDWSRDFWTKELLGIWNKQCAIKLTHNNKKPSWDMFYNYFLDGSVLLVSGFDLNTFHLSLKENYINNNLTKEILATKIKEHLTHALQ